MIQWIKSLFGGYPDQETHDISLDEEAVRNRRRLNAFFETYKPLEVSKAEYVQGLLTITYNDNTVTQYKGDCTIWHTYPMMERCSTSVERRLCDMQAYIKEHGNPYPTAHLKPKE